MPGSPFDAPIDPDPGSARWEKMWAGGLRPGDAFDATTSAGALKHLLADAKLDVKGKHVLVPGCGRGYDVVEFVQHGAASATGLDIAPTACKAADAYIDSLGLDPALRARAAFSSDDFFTHSRAGGAPYDVVYDYTFFCAIQPSQREAWAETMARIIAPGGTLVTLMFPIGKDPKSPGPPWGLTYHIYNEVLSREFQEVEVNKVDPALSHPGREGMEWLGLWTRK